MANTTKKSKIETVLAEQNTTTNAEPASKPEEIRKPAKRQQPKADPEPERELDWRPIGLVKEHRSAKQRAARKIERLRLRWLAYALDAFIMGASMGIMIFNWLH